MPRGTKVAPSPISPVPLADNEFEDTEDGDVDVLVSNVSDPTAGGEKNVDLSFTAREKLAEPLRAPSSPTLVAPTSSEPKESGQTLLQRRLHNKTGASKNLNFDEPAQVLSPNPVLRIVISGVDGQDITNDHGQEGLQDQTSATLGPEDSARLLVPPSPMASLPNTPGRLAAGSPVRRRLGAWAGSVSSLAANINRGIHDRLKRSGSTPANDSDTDDGNLLGVKGVPVNVAVAYRFTQDAMEGRQKNGKGGLFFKSYWVQLAFLININERWVNFLYLVSIFHCLLVLFEPADRSTRTDPWVLTVEAIIIIIYATDVILKISYVGRKKYFKKQHHQLQTGVTFLFLIDWLLYTIFDVSPRFSRMLRPGILLIRHRDLRKTVNVLVKMLPDLIGIFAGLAAYIIFFGMLGIHLFADEYNQYTPPPGGEDYMIPGAFDNIGAACLRLFVLFSTENYPEIAVPAFDHNRWSILYFITFMYFGTFFLQSVLLATIVSIYLDRAAKTVSKERKKEWKTLATAFTLLDEEKLGYITFETWAQLMSAMRKDATVDEARFYFDLLDREHAGKIDPLDFLDLREISQLRLKEVKQVERQHAFLNDSWISWATNTGYAAFFSHAVIVVNTIVACIHWRGMSSRDEKYVLYTNVALYTLMVTGKILQIVADGRFLYFVNLYNRIDSVCVAVAGPLLIAATVDEDLMQLAIFANMLLFVRLSWRLPQGRMVLQLMSRIIPPMFFMTLFVLCAMYSFAILGMELFYGIDSGDPTDAYFYEYDCSFGFNSFGCAMLVLFQCMTTSNWHEIMNSFIDHFRDTSALYFVGFFLFVNLVLMNLMVAVTIEAYLTARKSVKHDQKKKIQSSAAMVSVLASPGERLSDITVSSTSTIEQGNGGQKFSRQSSVASIGADSVATEPEVKNSRILRKIWHAAAKSIVSRRPSGTSVTTEEMLSEDGESTISTETPRLYTVIRRYGSWRRELVQTKTDSLSALESDDIKAIGKATGGTDIDKLLEQKRKNEKERKSKTSVDYDFVKYLAITESALKHPSPVVRRFGSSSIQRGSVDILPEGGYTSPSPEPQLNTLLNSVPKRKRSMLFENVTVDGDIPEEEGTIDTEEEDTIDTEENDNKSGGNSPLPSIDNDDTEDDGGIVVERLKRPPPLLELKDNVHVLQSNSDGSDISRSSPKSSPRLSVTPNQSTTSLKQWRDSASQQSPVARLNSIARARSFVVDNEEDQSLSENSAITDSDDEDERIRNRKKKKFLREESPRVLRRRKSMHLAATSNPKRGSMTRRMSMSTANTMKTPNLRRWASETTSLEVSVAESNRKDSQSDKNPTQAFSEPA